MTIMHESPADVPAATPIVERTPRWTDARDQMIHACALQEHIIASAPVLPTDVRVNARYALVHGYQHTSDEIDVEVYLHQNPEAVAAYQVAFGGELRREVRSNGTKLYTELTGYLAGCRFSVWALTDVTA